MKVGDLVVHLGWEDDGVGIVIATDTEEIGDPEEVLVMWNDGDGLMNHSTCTLEVINESR